ncbi:Nucleolar protein 56 [Intoshia linei]|uniref:Nucleolar protein 56 n=1 Tax=Intoshia linei TaxID=1819745 RepID=A0A177BBX7_9BILA|nr:Nucleolar protein 56 [Intoshia linei]
MTLSLFILFEHATGYALFDVVEFEEIGFLEGNIEYNVTDYSRFKSVVKLTSFLPFKGGLNALDNINAISEATIHEDLMLFLDTNVPKSKKKRKVFLGISDPKLGASMGEQFSVKCVATGAVPEIMRGIRMHFVKLVGGMELDLCDKSRLGLAHSYSRCKVKFNVNRADNMIIQSIAILDQLEKDVNTFSMRLREWYSYHFPELYKFVTDNELYAKCTKIIQNKEDFTDEKIELLKSILEEGIVESIVKAAKFSTGMEISDFDLINISIFSKKIVSLSKYKTSLKCYLSKKMNTIAPNLSTLIGDQVGARLISHAGSLSSLAKYPASTVQILGAEKALFRALKKKGNTPKYGLIFHSQFIGRAKPKHKGRISRLLANKCSIASRIDCYSDNLNNIIGTHLKQQVEDKLKHLDDGTIPEKNIDVMKKAVVEIQSLNLSKTTKKKSSTSVKKEDFKKTKKSNKLKKKFKKMKKEQLLQDKCNIIVFVNYVNQKKFCVILMETYFWLSDESTTNCFVCKSKFTLVNRRHHCRLCGNIFCNKCSQKRSHLFNALLNLKGAVRLCAMCFKVYQNCDKEHLFHSYKYHENVINRLNSDSQVYKIYTPFSTLRLMHNVQSGGHDTAQGRIPSSDNVYSVARKVYTNHIRNVCLAMFLYYHLPIGFIEDLLNFVHNLTHNIIIKGTNRIPLDETVQIKKKITNDGAINIECFHGLMIKFQSVFKRMNKCSVNAFILLVQNSINLTIDETVSDINVFIGQEKEFIEKISMRLKKFNVKIIITSGSINASLYEALIDENFIIVENIKIKSLKSVQNLYGGLVLDNIHFLKNIKQLAVCSMVHIVPCSNIDVGQNVIILHEEKPVGIISIVISNKSKEIAARVKNILKCLIFCVYKMIIETECLHDFGFSFKDNQDVVLNEMSSFEYLLFDLPLIHNCVKFSIPICECKPLNMEICDKQNYSIDIDDSDSSDNFWFFNESNDEIRNLVSDYRLNISENMPKFVGHDESEKSILPPLSNIFINLSSPNIVILLYIKLKQCIHLCCSPKYIQSICYNNLNIALVKFMQIYFFLNYNSCSNNICSRPLNSHTIRICYNFLQIDIYFNFDFVKDLNFQDYNDGHIYYIKVCKGCSKSCTISRSSDYVLYLPLPRFIQILSYNTDSFIFACDCQDFNINNKEFGFIYKEKCLAFKCQSFKYFKINYPTNIYSKLNKNYHSEYVHKYLVNYQTHVEQILLNYKKLFVLFNKSLMMYPLTIPATFFCDWDNFYNKFLNYCNLLNFDSNLLNFDQIFKSNSENLYKKYFENVSIEIDISNSICNFNHCIKENKLQDFIQSQIVLKIDDSNLLKFVEEGSILLSTTKQHNFIFKKQMIKLSIILKNDEISTVAACALDLFETHSYLLVSNNKQLHKEIDFYNSKFTYCVIVYFANNFANLRKLKSLYHENFIFSLIQSSLLKASGGKSGSKFFITHDNRFVLKYIPSSDVEKFGHISKKYFEYVLDIIQNNVYISLLIYPQIRGDTGHDLLIVIKKKIYGQIFDLKGSKRNRFAKYNLDATLDNNSQQNVLLDQNFTEYGIRNPIYIDKETKKKLDKALKGDTDFFLSQSIIDYSFLLGINPQKNILSIGIVDYIGLYTWPKRMENVLKSTFTISGNEQPTIIEPEQYKNRFIEAMNNYIICVSNLQDTITDNLKKM